MLMTETADENVRKHQAALSEVFFSPQNASGIDGVIRCHATPYDIAEGFRDYAVWLEKPVYNAPNLLTSKAGAQKAKGSQGQFQHVGHNGWAMRNDLGMQEDFRTVGGKGGVLLWPGGLEGYPVTGMMKCSQFNKVVRGARTIATYQTRFALNMTNKQANPATFYDVPGENIVQDDKPEAFEWGCDDELANAVAIREFNESNQDKCVQANVWDLIMAAGRRNHCDLSHTEKFTLAPGVLARILSTYDQLTRHESEKPGTISSDFQEFCNRCRNPSTHEYKAFMEIVSDDSETPTLAIHDAAITVAKLREMVYFARHRDASVSYSDCRHVLHCIFTSAILDSRFPGAPVCT